VQAEHRSDREVPRGARHSILSKLGPAALDHRGNQSLLHRPRSQRAGARLRLFRGGTGTPRGGPGDRWCLRAPRWQEAFEAGQTPRVVLRALTRAPWLTARSPISNRWQWTWRDRGNDVRPTIFIPGRTRTGNCRTAPSRGYARLCGGGRTPHLARRRARS